MTTPTTTAARRLTRRLVGAGLLAVGLAACTPAQMALFTDVTEQHREVLTEGQLALLRDCESGERYDAVSASGAYRGAYQFSRGTWDAVAARHYPWLVGEDPAATPFYWQDAMAKALFAESGSSPWPHCGRGL